MIYQIYRSNSKSHVSVFEIDRKNGADRFIIVLGKVLKMYNFNKNNFPKSFFSKCFPSNIFHLS